MRPLVAWSEVSPSTTPIRKAEPPSSLPPRKQDSSSFGAKRTPPRFPLEKLVSPRRELEGEPAIPTPPPEVDGMDWTPSVQHNIRPTVSVHQRNERSVLDGPLPFHGSLPAAPQPPSWILRNKPTPKPIEQVVEPNPFHRTPTQCPGPWQQSPAPQEPAFAPPKFFPPSDHVASTGLESLFDQTFTIRSPEEEGGNLGRRPKQASYPRTDVQDYLLFQYVRLGLLLTSIAAWGLSQGGYISVPGNYIEVISLGSASLIAGFGLLEVLKQPMVHWNGMEIMVYLAELVVPVHLGYNLPRASFEREYFDRYGKLLLIFMASQEVLGLLFFYRTATVAGQEEQPVRRLHQEQQQTQPAHPNRVDSNPIRKSRSPSESHASLSSLSLSSTAPGSSSLIQPSEPQFQQGFRPNEGFKDHSFSLESLKSADSDDSYGSGDSDTETTMTTATTATNSTIRNIRYGGNFVGIDSLYSPNRTELGPRIGGLSLEDKPARTTRSQTQQRLRGNAPGSGMGTGSNRYAARRVK